ncbi:MAG: HIT family protein [Candidatus Harrisonbacteria bacterium]|nr:HIT family protein [Candidatus Harrisonbacteria bacterium]
MECLFCKIISKQIPSETIYEDDSIFAFLDIHPLSKGHILVIPKVHADTLETLPESEITPLFTAVQKITRAAKPALSPSAFTIGINNGKDSGQAIDHLHIHIIPRFPGDGGHSLHSVVQSGTDEPLSITCQKIRDRL